MINQIVDLVWDDLIDYYQSHLFPLHLGAHGRSLSFDHEVVLSSNTSFLFDLIHDPKLESIVDMTTNLF